MCRCLKLFLLLSVALISLAVIHPACAAGQGMSITEMAVTTKIVKGKPIDSVHRISSRSVKALYCFTRLTSGSEETSIKHVWYRNGEKVSEHELPVKGDPWRTFSKQPVDRNSSGDWRVDAVDSEGKTLQSVKFQMN